MVNAAGSVAFLPGWVARRARIRARRIGSAMKVTGTAR
jgi:hypothetical protein